MRVIIIISQELEDDNAVAEGKVTEAGEGCRAYWMRYRGLFAIYIQIRRRRLQSIPVKY